MNNIFIKSKINIKRINIYYLLSLAILLISGFYKNGILIYIETDSLIDLFKPLIFDVLGLFIGGSVNIIYERIFRKNNNNIFDIFFSSFHPIYGLLIASLCYINTPTWLFFAITFIFLLISKFFKSNLLNVSALTSIIIFVISNLMGYNVLVSNNLNLNLLDYIIGKSYGAINTTFILGIIIGLVILSSKSFYKKEIPFYSFIIYLLCIIVYSIITKDYNSILNNLLSNNIIFILVFVASIPNSSPYTRKGMLFYSIIVATCSFGLSLIYPSLAALGAVLLASLCQKSLDKIFKI